MALLQEGTEPVPRSLGLSTLPDLANAEVAKITEPEAIVGKAAEMEQAAINLYNGFAVECGQNADSATKQLFEFLVNDEEGHFDEFDKQVDNIKRFGPSYLALQSFGSAPAEASGEA